ncbi:hypothetical protein LDENG_00040510 [Lucifuga dentata]|nr:hypothetical protein LDENG_00040510 [Lucifuga dentata]
MDRGDLQQKTLSLVIKTPNQAQKDQTIEGVSPNWTVKDLKTHLSSVCPTKPPVCDQRLIYAGKLLPDHLNIKDLFRQTDSIPTLHLVCAFRNPTAGALGARPKTKEAEQPHSQSHSANSPSSPNSNPRPMAASVSPSISSRVQAPSTPELRQRRPTSISSAAEPLHTQTPAASAGPGAAAPGGAEMTQPAFPTYSLYSPQQLLWLQHVYARQYYMQYHAAWAAAGSTSLAPAATIGPYPPVPAYQAPIPAPLANQNPINNLPANQNPVQDAAFINADANQNMRMNAQGGPVMEDEEDMDRDWLDWVYSATRFGILLMIVYFNSSLSRFVLVIGTLILMYLHTAGWFPFRRRAQVQVPNPPQPPQAQHNEVQNPNPHEELVEREEEELAAAAAAAVEESDRAEVMAAVLVPPHRVSFMWTTWVFFKTFFSSLIPEVHGVAN